MPEPLVVVLTRDAGLLRALRRLLRREGFTVPDAAAERPGPPEDVAGVLVDARLLAEPDGPDLAVLQATFASAAVLVMAARVDHPTLVAAQRSGALALTADFDLQALVDTLRGDDGPAGVREPRRPRLPAGTAGVALDVPRG